MLSVAARAYLVWQVFDFVHRSDKPVRFAYLQEEVEDLAAWPEFRDAALRDPRFLVVGDVIEIATAGIHKSAPVEEIILQTLDLVRVPVPNQTLARMVDQLRPDLKGKIDPVERALGTGQLLRPWTGHLARRQWLHGARPIPLPLWLPCTVTDAAREVLTQAEGPVSAADLAAALAERFDISVVEAYQQMGSDKTLLFLPGGTLALYDSVSDEVADAVGTEYSYDVDHESLAGGITPADLPRNLVQQVIERCRRTEAPVSTGEILTHILGLATEDERYVATFRAVSADLGIAPELVPVGENRWYPSELVPAEVWLPVRPDPGEGSHPKGALPPPDLAPPLPVIRFGATAMHGNVTVRVTAANLNAGALSDARLAGLLPEHPILQAYPWNGMEGRVWYNTEHNAIYGLTAWFRDSDVQPTDTVTISFRDGRLSGSVKQGVRTPQSTGTKSPWLKEKGREQHRSLLPAITEILTRAGGSLQQEELMLLLNEEDNWISWNQVLPLFERLPILRYDQGRCFLVRQLSGKRDRSGETGAMRAEILGILSDMPDEVREDPRVLFLIRLVSGQPRIPARDEAILLPAAQRERGPEWERLVLGHLRYALTNLLRRREVPMLLPHLEDYFQEAALGVMAAADRYDRSKAPRLQHGLGWSLLSALNRARLELHMPLRFPAHFGERLFAALAEAPCTDDVEQTEDDDPGAGQVLIDLWSTAAWESWEELMVDYEEGALEITALTMGEPLTFPEAFVERRSLTDCVHRILREFDPRTQDVLIRRFGLNGGEEETLEEIASSYRLTRERIRQIEAKAMGQLKARTRKLKDLREFLIP